MPYPPVASLLEPRHTECSGRFLSSCSSRFTPPPSRYRTFPDPSTLFRTLRPRLLLTRVSLTFPFRITRTLHTASSTLPSLVSRTPLRSSLSLFPSAHPHRSSPRLQNCSWHHLIHSVHTPLATRTHLPFQNDSLRTSSSSASFTPFS